MHFRMMLHRIFRKIKIKELFRSVSTLVLAVALCFSSTAISVYATAIVPIGSEIISQATDFGVAEYLFNLLRNGYSIDFSNYNLQWEDFVNDWKDEGLVKASIDKFIDNLQGIEYSTTYTKNVDFLNGRDRQKLINLMESNSSSEVAEPIELDSIQMELLKGAYNLNNQNLYEIPWGSWTNSYWGNHYQDVDYNNSSKLAIGSNGRNGLKYWIESTDLAYYINLNDYSVTLYDSTLTMPKSNTNFTSKYFAGTTVRNYPFYTEYKYNSLSSIAQFYPDRSDTGSDPITIKFENSYQYFISQNGYVPSLNNALMLIWGSKDVPIYCGYRLSDAMLLENPFQENYFFDGGFALTTSGENPLVANYPEGSIIDLISLVTSIKSAISNKTKLDLSDIEDLIVDVNGQRAVATYEVYRDDYDVLSQEIFAPYELVVSPDPVYMEAFGSGLETAGNIINSSVDVIPNDISLFLFGGAFVLLIILVLRRGSE